MTATNAKDFLPLVQALADGKTLQNKTCDGWVDLPGNAIAFSNYPESYRIKPEPREWILNVYDDGDLYAHTSMQSAKGSSENSRKKVQQVRVREILD